MEIRILRLFHWNVVSWPGFFKKNRTGKEKVTAEEWKRAVITVMIGEHECHYSPCCCRMKGFHTDRRLLQCSVQDDCYCAVLRDPPQNPNPPSAVTQGHFIQWDDSEMLSLALFLFAVKWGLCFLPQGFLFFWCHMLNLVHHCKSLRFTLHVRGEERCSHFKAPSSFICSSMIPSLLSGDGWQDAQSLPEMGSFHHSHMPQSWSPLRWRGCVNGFCLRMDVSSLPLQNVNGLFHRDCLKFVQGHAAVWPFVLPLCVVWQITLWWTTAPVSKPVPATRWRWRRTESRCASPARISAQKVITRNIKLTQMLIKVHQNVMLWWP